jgi:hypothetical protein
VGFEKSIGGTCQGQITAACPVFIASRASWSHQSIQLPHHPKASAGIAGDLSSRATEEELIQLVRADADHVDGPNLLGRQSGSPKSGPFVLQEPLDLESRSWPIGMGRWPGPTPASHHPLVKSNALGLKLSAHGTHNATRFDRRPTVGSLCDCNTGVLTDQPPGVTSRDAKLGCDVVDLEAQFVEATGADKPIGTQVDGATDLQRF